MMERHQFEHPLLEKALKELNQGNLFENEVMFVYENYEQKKILPDIIGKTVHITENQFPHIYQLNLELSKKIGMDPLPVYVYEDFYYGLECKGINTPWIEISSKTITDFTDKELLFLLARELGKVKMNYHYYHILLEEAEKAVHMQLFDQGVIKDSWKLVMYRWSRLSHYSLDNFGYALCGDIASAISAISKTVLNSSFLAEQLHVPDYIKQSEDLQELDDDMYLFTKMDERVPYAPHRIKSLIRYASSERGMKAAKYFHGGRN